MHSSPYVGPGCDWPTFVDCALLVAGPVAGRLVVALAGRLVAGLHAVEELAVEP